MKDIEYMRELKRYRPSEYYPMNTNDILDYIHARRETDPTSNKYVYCGLESIEQIEKLIRAIDRRRGYRLPPDIDPTQIIGTAPVVH